ncbi:hypothetical protein OEZ85_002460 [Tetradesmus obliquus]|uniref:PI3K/PI4K catalytic domain-containing protein n=1 Tax=Tetradesmus obliquus TaxID=3088 RepID=A0ABY8TXK2_TETOB|nr:hypothetical protein OEZ85_002460 [Tetradesmus obliquus]
MHRRHGSTDRHATKEWELLWALFTTQDTHQQQLLCAELLQLPAERINRYLLEYVYLAVSRPSGPLEHAITELCGRSFNTAVQVSWLLLALLQDQPGNRHIRQFRDACEHAALMGGAPSHPHYLHTFSQGAAWLVSHEEELLSTSMLLEMPPRSPRHAAGRDSFLASLDFVDALCETSANLTRFPQEERRRVLRKCLCRINQEVMDAAEQGVAVRYPIGGCRSRVLRLLVNEAAILNSRDKAPFLLMLEVQQDQDFVDEVLPGSSSSRQGNRVMCRAASRDFTATSITAAGPSRQRTAAAAAAAGRGQLLQVHLEVVAAAPVVQHLALHCRKGRRLPSLEAIDIIAGKLGKAAIPPPTEIGPPLPGELSSSSSSSMDGDAECIPYVTGASASSSHLKTVDEAEVAGHDGWQDVASTGAAASPKQRQRKQQHQQQKASGGWWGFLRKQQPAAAAAHVDQLVTQEQQQQAAESAEAAAERLAQQAEAVYGESWEARCARVRASSPFDCRPGWGLAGVIVKSGDDCRQELLALQLIRELGDIWAAAGLPLWVLPFEVLVTSAGTALIQLIPDSTSVHSIKQRSAAAAATAAAAAAAASAASDSAATASPAAGAAAAAAGSSSGGVSLSEHFFAKWRRGSPECLAAQRRFVESLAAYSLVTYLLQVKDRHNGNIMMDSSGRLVHIDFGFLLSNAPGGGWLAFEAAPMKLSRELMEVMDSNSEGQPSELFDYFKVLCIQGFLAARKERQRITRLVTIMAHCARPSAPGAGAGAAPSGNIPTSSGSSSSSGAAAAAGAGQAPSWPCFRAGPERVLAALEGRFVPQLSEAGCVQHVLRLISGSLDAWSTRQYDYYQRVLNGIL